MKYSLYYLFSDNFFSNSLLPVDVLETPEYFEIYVDVPGIPKENIKVTAETEGVVTISVNNEPKEANGIYLVHEREVPVRAERKITLPKKLATGKVSAKLENGVLVVTLWKAQKDLIEVEIK